MADIELSRKVRALILAFLIVLYLVLYLKVVIVGANNVTAPKEIVNQPLNKTVLPKVGIGIGLVDFETAEEREKVAYMALEAGFRMIDLWEG